MMENAKYWKIMLNLAYKYESNSEKDILESRIRYEEEK